MITKEELLQYGFIALGLGGNVWFIRKITDTTSIAVSVETDEWYLHVNSRYIKLQDIEGIKNAIEVYDAFKLNIR